MNSFKNKVQLLGRLGSAPEMKNLENGNMLARLSVATNEIYKNAKGEKVEETQWHNVVLWGKLAEIAKNYLNKGSEVMIEGRINYREYTTADGQKRSATEIVGLEMMMMDKKQPA